MGRGQSCGEKDEKGEYEVVGRGEQSERRKDADKKRRGYRTQERNMH